MKRNASGWFPSRGGGRAVAAGLGVAIVLGACATASGAAGADELAVRRVAAACVPERQPSQLPPLESLVNTARLDGALRALREGASVDSGQVVLTLWYDEAGTNVRRDVIGHTLTPLLADSVQELLFASLAPVPATGEAWGARMLISLGSEVPYALGHRVYCPPKPLNRSMEADMSSYTGTGVRYRGGRRERVVLMEAVVHPGGYVDDARIVRGADRGSQLEKQLRDALRQYSFEPASLDGVPVYGVVTVPVRTRG